jgi:hypothetical protein
VYGSTPPAVVNVNLIEFDVVVPPFCTVAPLPSIAEVIVVISGSV